MILVSIQDTVAKLFLAPFVERSPETASRTFSLLCKEPGMISKAPVDFQLFQVGEFDEHTGIVKPVDHLLIITGNQVQEQLKNV